MESWIYRVMHRPRKAKRFELLAVIDNLTAELDAERAISEGLRKGLVMAVDPFNMSGERIEAMMSDAATDPDSPVVQMPDGEYIAPGSYDWERLARDIIDTEQGGASGEW